MIKFYTNLFKTLSHPLRFQIVVGLLQKQECNVQTMCEKLDVSQPMVSQHLAVLRKAKIVETNRNGNQICYYIKDPKIKKLIKLLGD
ncbi:MAG: winged helix-turn-helix transcriptional regulator [Alphaproteobacteria bacterium]|nr:winged helix-turn-helix transcriptional regulator [Alphaproteobacteria bacterium]MBN2675208.1 winged helix-turn-helix transcriptional regulator [Alphaproteobacteria bacterium]